MDWTSFGLSRNPFERAADLDDSCLPNTMAALLAQLQGGLRSPQGLSLFVGETGCGKSLAAAAFARRLSSSAQVVLLEHPASSITGIAREALAKLDPDACEFPLDDDWASALRSSVARRGNKGRATVLLLDDAHRFSPQTLEGLAGLFGDDEELRLHVVLFGRPRLVERLQAGSGSATESHLLQVCRLDALRVRESVRYLERRFALCGAELPSLFDDEAIDEMIQKGSGRLLHLERIAEEALKRARRRGAARASLQDVAAIGVHSAVPEEGEPMATHQQPLRFDRLDLGHKSDDEDGVAWGSEEEAEADVWGDEADDEETWETGDGAAPDGPLNWDSGHRLDDDEDGVEEFPAGKIPAPPPARRRMVGPAVLSVAACVGLIWAANHVPGPSSDARHGRDATMFARPLEAEPGKILRLATTVEAADADAHVAAWRAMPVEVARAAGSAGAAASPVPAPDPGASASAPKTLQPAADSPLPAVAAVPTPAGDVGPQAPETVASSPRIVAKAAHQAQGEEVASRAPVATASRARTVEARKPEASRSAGGAVYTVQLGAFKARSNAEDLVAKLRGKSPRILREGGLYRVMSGSFASKRDASLHEVSLKRAGYTTYVRSAVF